MLAVIYILVMKGTAMARIALFTESHLLDAWRIRDNAHHASEVIQALAVLLPAEIKLNAMYTTRVLGISERTLFRYQADIRNQDALSKESCGSRRYAFLSTEE